MSDDQLPLQPTPLPEKPQNKNIHLLPWLSGVILVMALGCLVITFYVNQKTAHNVGQKNAYAYEEQLTEQDFEPHISFEYIQTPEETIEDIIGHLPEPITAPAADWPKIAIVIDDMGVAVERSKAIVKKLPKEITLSFLPYGEATATLSKQAAQKGHELMLHLPMEPSIHADGQIIDPGPDALTTNASTEELIQLTEKNLTALKETVIGVNNHMGSKFTGNADALLPVLQTVKAHNLFFLDSITTRNSQVDEVAAEINLPILKRHVFIDHFQEPEKIAEALQKLEFLARKNGVAIAIGHPYDETTNALAEWVKTLPEKQLNLVPISTLIK